MREPIVTDGANGVRQPANLREGEADPRVFAAMQEYMAEIEAGRHPNRKEFLARHAEVAGELSACLHGLAFVKAAAPDRNDPTRLYNPADFDFRLRPGSPPIDAGQPLPGVNDGFAGKAPDLGAYEAGAPLPHYGPRPRD